MQIDKKDLQMAYADDVVLEFFNLVTSKQITKNSLDKLRGEKDEEINRLKKNRFNAIRFALFFSAIFIISASAGFVLHDIPMMSAALIFIPICLVFYGVQIFIEISLEKVEKVHALLEPIHKDLDGCIDVLALTKSSSMANEWRIHALNNWEYLLVGDSKMMKLLGEIEKKSQSHEDGMNAVKALHSVE